MKALYIHVPFCHSICYYCDFTRCLYQETLVDAWLDRIQRDLQEKDMDMPLKTIYIGGGTPTSLSAAQLTRLLQMLFVYQENVEEYTMESNIESLDAEKIQLLKRYGVTRISLGVQSFQDDLLQMMNRKHTKDMAIAKLQELSAAGFHDLSIDLIYGFAMQTKEMWRKDLAIAASLPYITHVSVYSLTIEEHSIFGKKGVQTCENEVEADFFELAIDMLEAAGFEQYEVANFARNHCTSKHNLMYWEYHDFYGIGVGASGKEGHIRYTFSGSVADYIKGEEKRDEEVLGKEDLMFENIMMSLRMRKGIDLDAFYARYGIKLQDNYADVIQEAIRNGEMEYEWPYLRVTKKGMFYLHDILVRFLK